MVYYLRTIPESITQVWKIDDGVAVRVGISNPERGPGSYFQAKPGETIWDAIKREATSWFGPNGENPFHKSVLWPGAYYPRMARPIDQHPTEAPGWSPGALIESNVIAVAQGQLTALTRQLTRICQTVHPNEGTFKTYGHDIRNLLILACTEVEAHWRGVLVANGVPKDRFTTKDYVVLCSAMRLDEYAVSFPNFPWLAEFKPFKGWASADRPTKELNWYAAYNDAKHDRESQFEKATLRSIFEAVSAVAVMIAAQFGLPHGLGQRSELRSFFHFSSVPVWPLSDIYIYPYDMPAGWVPVHFEFQATVR